MEQMLNLEEIGALLYRGYAPNYPRWGWYFGGLLMAQSLAACSRTVGNRL
jgi:acyl-CoA thioesterase